MSRFDLVIFGATGFTGKKAVEEIARVSKKYGPLTWAVAGRSQSKLETLMAELSEKTGEDLKGIKIFIADVFDEKSLKDMCQQARVVVNCCGPYRLYGEPVVKTAIECGAHYVDVSGEPQFIETMQLKYNQAASEAGVYIISACGLDSIPNDMGVVFLQQNFDGTLNSVESYLSTDLPPQYQEQAKSGVIHYGTWESLVYGLAHGHELAPLRKKMFPQRLPNFKPKLKARSKIHNHNGKYCVPFMGADGSIVYRTQRSLYEERHKRPVQFKPYFTIGSLCNTVLAVLGGVLFYLMCMTSLTRKLLLAYPHVFSFGLVSHEGPKEEVMNNTSFTLELYGEGWAAGTDVDSTPPNKKMAAKVSGMNPGYGATVTMLIFAAITILKQQDVMPGNGGVMTTGVAFYNTDLIKYLNENNVKFEIVENK